MTDEAQTHGLNGVMSLPIDQGNYTSVCVYQKAGKMMMISQDVLESVRFGHDIYSLE